MSSARGRPAQWRRWQNVALACAVLLAGTVAPRLLLLGGLPATDEGVYAFQAQWIHHSLAGGHGLPADGTLALYPLLLSWVFGLSFNPIVLLRLADLCVAAWAALLLYRVLAAESGSRNAAALLTLVFGFTLNQEPFIQHGFKNSMAAAFVPLLLALRVAQQARGEAQRPWWTAGALTALAVLLRETFAPFAALGLGAVLVARGRPAALRFAAGGGLAGAALLGLAVLGRGGAAGLVAAYREAGSIYGAMADQAAGLFVASGLLAARASWVALCLALLAGAVLPALALRRRDRALALRAAFWWLAAVLPLIEPAAKIGFPYHFAVALPGLAGLCALAWRALPPAGPRRLATAAGTAALAVLLVLKSPPLLGLWPGTRDILAAAPGGGWPAWGAAASNYLLAAEAIRKAAPAHGTLGVSGSMLALYPLTRQLPPSPALANLSTTLILLDLSPERLREALLRCPPDVLMTTTRTDWPGGPQLLAAVRATGLYEQVAVVPVSADRSYGSFGGLVFRARQPGPCVDPVPR